MQLSKTKQRSCNKIIKRLQDMVMQESNIEKLTALNVLL